MLVSGEEKLVVFLWKSVIRIKIKPFLVTHNNIHISIPPYGSNFKGLKSHSSDQKGVPKCNCWVSRLTVILTLKIARLLKINSSTCSCVATKEVESSFFLDSAPSQSQTPRD